MVNETAPGPVFCVFGVKKLRTFYFKLTEQSSRKKLAVGGFEPEKVRLLYPAPKKTALLSTTTRVQSFHVSGPNRLKMEKNKQNGLRSGQHGCSEAFFSFTRAIIPQNSPYIFVSF